MTCIVAVKDRGAVVMGADACSASNINRNTATTPKVFEREGLLIGGCGSWRELNLLRHKLEVPLPLPEPEDAEAYMVQRLVPAILECLEGGSAAKKSNSVAELAGSYLVAIGERIFMILSDLSVVEHVDDFLAAGSGEDFALGALFATQGRSARSRVQKALEAASYLSPSVDGPFTIVRGRRRKQS